MLKGHERGVKCILDTKGTYCLGGGSSRAGVKCEVCRHELIKW